ncbi:hypothetical protein ACE1B6_27500 [Aerosakkonemataceae cyanobacterium BLCC-F154]|uniref:Uncharacterized protein n=1 Tax=Floridaenema fluviatile BLCC-F154 TaxID=3153640 RepID=A0ABV4YKH3_9CYAN
MLTESILNCAAEMRRNYRVGLADTLNLVMAIDQKRHSFSLGDRASVQPSYFLASQLQYYLTCYAFKSHIVGCVRRGYFPFYIRLYRLTHPTA